MNKIPVSVPVKELIVGGSYRCKATSPAGNNDDICIFVGFSKYGDPLFTSKSFPANFVLDPSIWTYYTC